MIKKNIKLSKLKVLTSKEFKELNKELKQLKIQKNFLGFRAKFIDEFGACIIFTDIYPTKKLALKVARKIIPDCLNSGFSISDLKIKITKVFITRFVKE